MKLLGKKILVTGGCGLIGSTIVDRILAAPPRERGPDAQITVLDNLSRGTLLNLEIWYRLFIENPIADTPPNLTVKELLSS